jgi:uncharacterized delta-60 repeat protein
MAGTLDLTFNNKGWNNLLTINPFSNMSITSSLIDNGKYVVTGFIIDPNNIDQLFIARYTNSGILDTTFNGTGYITKTFYTGKISRGLSIAIDNGNYVVTGFTLDNNGITQLLITRYTNSGILDTTFNGTGYITKTFYTDKDSRGNSIAIDNGNYVVTGLTEDPNNIDQLFIARYTNSGILDTAFNGTGYITKTFYTDKISTGNSIAIDNGNYVVTGVTEDINDITQLLITRYTNSGILDTAFNGTGYITKTFYTGKRSTGNSIAIDNGNYVVTGLTEDINGISQLFITRYTNSGILDTAFNGTGYITKTFYTDKISTGNSIAIDNGNYVVTGATEDNNDIPQLLITRYTNSGILDTAFNGTGYITKTFYTGKGSTGLSIAIDNGNYVVTGLTVDNIDIEQLFITRYTNSGILDTAFNGTGYVNQTFYNNDSNIFATSSVIDNGKYVVTGFIKDPNDIDQLFIARYTNSGILDTTFNNPIGYITKTFYTDKSSRGFSIAIDNGNYVVTGGTEHNNGINQLLLITRYTNSGILDTTFNGTGYITKTFYTDKISRGASIAIDNGNYVVTGGTADNNDIPQLFIARYTNSGILDTTFNNPIGYITKTFYTNKDSTGASIAIDNGNYVVTGATEDNNDIPQLLITRYTNSGILDTAFNGTGYITKTFYTDKISRGNSIAIDNGNYVVTGATVDNNDISQLFITRYTNSGILDTAFNGTGYITKTFYTGKGSRGFSIAIDNGNYVVTGRTADNNDISQLFITRYTNSGILDTAFNGTGYITKTFYTGKDSEGNSIAIDNGNYVVTGLTADNTDIPQLLITRYTNSGSVDTTFNGTGYVNQTLYTIYYTIIGLSVTVDNDKYIICGSIINKSGVISSIIARYTNNGILDTTFNIIGYNYQNFNNLSEFNSITVDNNGNYIATGYLNDGTKNNLLIARYTNSGNLDTTFNGTGYITKTFYTGKTSRGTSITINNEGQYVITGSALDNNNIFQLFVIIYNRDGSLYTTFNGTGYVTSTFYTGKSSRGTSIAIDNGKYVVTGFTGDNNDIARLLVARYTSTGILDTTFNGTGFVAKNFYSDSIGNSIVVDNDNKYVITGYIGSTSDDNQRSLIVIRYNNNGIIDNTFNAPSGYIIQSFYSDKGSEGKSIKVDSYGYYIVSGYTYVSEILIQLVIARYTNDGGLDTIFNGTGYVSQSFGTNILFSIGNSINIDNDGNYITTGIVGTNDISLLIARYLAKDIPTTTTTKAPTTTSTTTSQPLPPYQYAIVRFSINADYSQIFESMTLEYYTAQLKKAMFYFCGAPIDSITVLSVTPGSIVNEVRLPSQYVNDLQKAFLCELFAMVLLGQRYPGIYNSFVIVNNICFHKGTQILTQNGYKPVENIQNGDLLITASGKITTVRKVISFIGTEKHCPLYVLPKNSIGHNVPLTDLYMSEGHAFRYKGNWCHMKCSSIAKKVKANNIEYYNIAVDNYIMDTLIANGVEVESLFNINHLNMSWKCKTDDCKPVIKPKNV